MSELCRCVIHNTSHNITFNILSLNHEKIYHLKIKNKCMITTINMNKIEKITILKKKEKKN